MAELLMEESVDKGERLKREGIVIRTFDLWKTYVMGDQVINAVSGVDIEIHRGEYVAIMGPSGSGKSTLMNLIGCLDSPTKGEYYINGRLVSSMTDDDLARIRNKEIGFVFQTFNLLPRATSLHNVELPLIYNGTPSAQRIQTAKAALAQVDLADRMTHKPNELSGGQSGSASPLRERWSTVRRSYSPTNPRASSITPPLGTRSWPCSSVCMTQLQYDYSRHART